MIGPFDEPELTQDQRELMIQIGLKFKKLYKSIKFDLKESRYKSLAIAELEKSFLLLRNHVVHKEFQDNSPNDMRGSHD